MINEWDLDSNNIDLIDILGLEHVKRGIEIALSGGHNMLLIGPHGSGKTSIATRCQSLIDGPFIAPHHTINYHEMIGNISNRSGQLIKAHGGILFPIIS